MQYRKFGKTGFDMIKKQKPVLAFLSAKSGFSFSLLSGRYKIIQFPKLLYDILFPFQLA